MRGDWTVRRASMSAFGRSLSDVPTLLGSLAIAMFDHWSLYSLPVLPLPSFAAFGAKLEEQDRLSQLSFLLHQHQTFTSLHTFLYTSIARRRT